MIARSMADARPIGEGERRAKARRRRMWTVLGALFVVGFVLGFGLSFADRTEAGFLEGPVPVWVAVLLSMVWLVAVVGGTWWYKTAVDELEIRINLWAMAVAGHAILLTYPVWWLMWRGGVFIEPNAHIMFGALYFVMLAAYCWKKFR